MSKLIKPVIPYGMVPNSLLNDARISLKAKGLFAFMQSKPDMWSFSVDKICYQCKESKSSVSEGLKELEMFGYLIRKKQQTGKGFTVDYSIFFKPKLIKPITDSQSLEIQSFENPIKENPTIGKSVNISKKDYSNKEYSNKEASNGALAFLEINYPSEFERLMMQFKKQIQDYDLFAQYFEATVLQEKLQYDNSVLVGRFTKYALSWISNRNKDDRKVIDLVPNQRKEKIGGI